MAGLIQDSNTNVTGNVLSDISNLNRNQTGTSRKKKNRKLTAVTDEPFHKKCSADDQECMKAQHRERAMEMDYFSRPLDLLMVTKKDKNFNTIYFNTWALILLVTCGLLLFFPLGFPKELPSLKRPKSSLRSPPRLLEEMLEEPILDRSIKLQN